MVLIVSEQRKGDRTHEIQMWLIQNEKKMNVTHWIAIDDLPLHKMNAKLMQNHFVQTDMHKGLLDEHIEECVELLSVKTCGLYQ